jgi:hypothetical protein
MIFFYPSTTLKKPQGRNLKCQISIQHFFKIVLYWCLDLIHHNIDTHLKHNKYIFDISIPFCHHLYLSATLKQCFTEFAVSENVVHHVYMSVPGQIPTCDLIGRLFLGSGLQRMCWLHNWQTWWWWNMTKEVITASENVHNILIVSSSSCLPITQSTHSLQSWP